MPAMPDANVTRWSLVVAAGSGDAAGREALAWLCRQYWDPLRAHARRRGWRDDEDAIQDFLVDLIQRGAFAQADRERGRFRTWLLTCLDHFLAKRAEAAAAQKRGGGRVERLPDGDEVAGASATAFDRDWAQAVLGLAEDRLAAEQSDQNRWQILRPFLSVNGDADAYRAAGARLGLGEGAVKVAIHRLRARLREFVRAGVADTLAEDDPRVIDGELDQLIAALAERR
jgi:RNA polymerase sigma-70 factor (ECF subfamily)